MHLRMILHFPMKADMRNKKFGANVHKENNFNVLKTVGIYGPNNAGKNMSNQVH